MILLKVCHRYGRPGLRGVPSVCQCFSWWLHHWNKPNMKNPGRGCCFNNCWCLRCDQSSGSVCSSGQLEPSSQPETTSCGAARGGEDCSSGPAGHGSSARCYSDPGWHHKGQEVNSEGVCVTAASMTPLLFFRAGFHSSRDHPSL